MLIHLEQVWPHLQAGVRPKMNGILKKDSDEVGNNPESREDCRIKETLAIWNLKLKALSYKSWPRITEMVSIKGQLLTIQI